MKIGVGKGLAIFHQILLADWVRAASPRRGAGRSCAPSSRSAYARFLVFSARTGSILKACKGSTPAVNRRPEGCAKRKIGATGSTSIGLDFLATSAMALVGRPQRAGASTAQEPAARTCDDSLPFAKSRSIIPFLGSRGHDDAGSAI